MRRIIFFKKQSTVIVTVAAMMFCASSAFADDRALWGSINGTSSSTYIKTDLNKILLTWRMLPGDNVQTAFDLYESTDGGETETKLNDKPIYATNYQLTSFPTDTDLTFRLTMASSNVTVGRYTISQSQLTNKLPYISIPLKGTEDVTELDSIRYCANDVSVGDLDGDGQMEIVVKRLRSIIDPETGEIKSDGSGAGMGLPNLRHNVLWDAYKLDGTFLWRVKSGPSISLGNSSSFAIADFDGDGKAEMVIKTGEGTVFGDSTEIGDTNGDGITDYRTWTGGYMDHYNSAGPEFFSVIDGVTGKELARADYINRETSESWGDGYWKRANSHRMGVAWFSTDYPSIFIGRGVYARTVAEAWDYREGQLTRRWRFDTSDSVSNNKDGKLNSAYEGQGNHSFSAADLDGDGKDEIMYGSMAIDDDGCGLWSTELGHGDAQHVGKFIADREGLQVWHCMESGTTAAALHDAKDGSVIWAHVDEASSDVGRCLVADIDSANPGCEYWWAGHVNAHDEQGNDLGYKPSSCNMAIWFDNLTNRQLINAGTINSYSNTKGRIFTMYRFDESFINSSKSNPSWYGDMLGDWREEIIVPDATKLVDLKIFSTWFKTDHRFPWLMTDHTYLMSALNENVGYNQPTHLGYYLGSDLTSDEEAWTTGITEVKDKKSIYDGKWYNLQGQRVTYPSHGIFIKNGRKYVVK